MRHFTLQKRWLSLLTAVLFFASLFSWLNFGSIRGHASRSDHDWYETFATASSYDEHRPVWSKPLEQPLTEKATVQPTGNVTLNSWHGTQMNYTITATEAAKVIQRTLYFPGWEVSVDGQSVPIQYEDEEYPGLIVVAIESGIHEVETQFTGSTVVRSYSHAVSLFSAGVIVFIFALGLRQVFHPQKSN